MTAAVLCMAFYNVWSRPFIQRSSALGFLTVGMGTGAAALILVGSLTGSVATLSQFSTAQWIAGLYLGVAGGAVAFILWVLALERGVTDPRRQHHDRQSACDRPARYPVGRRADYAQPGARAGRSVCRHLDRNVGGQKGAAVNVYQGKGLPQIMRPGRSKLAVLTGQEPRHDHRGPSDTGGRHRELPCRY